MSRIGLQPRELPTGVEVSVDDSVVTVKGPKGELSQKIDSAITVSNEDSSLKVTRKSDDRTHKALHGLTRSLIYNMVHGVHSGFSKSLEFVGVGYRAQQKGKGVSLSVMLSHSVEIDPPDGVDLNVEGNNLITVTGIDKQKVGQLAAEIKSIRPPNVYTGSGIRYRGEQIKLKPGKSARRVVE